MHDINSGGYNLYADVPLQKEPDTDYLFKFNGDIVKIPPLNPCRVHFGEWFSRMNLFQLINKVFFFNISGIFTDGDAIYIGGGQTMHNE